MTTASPTPEERKAGVAAVFGRAAATYDQVGVEFFGPVGRLLVERTQPAPGERVLDVGCGRGASALPAAARVGEDGSVLAVDLAPEMVEAVRRAAADVPWLAAEVGDAEAPPSGPFDVVQAGLVLFFLPDPGAALERYREALVPDGRLGFTWFGADDPRWESVFDVVASVMTEGDRPPGRTDDDGPFSSVRAMHAFLEEHGYDDVDTTTTVLDVGVRDADHWLEWSWSHGFRGMLERIEAAGAMGEVRDRLEPELRQIAADGTLTWRAEIHTTLARSRGGRSMVTPVGD